jgi:hypothetical protein
LHAVDDNERAIIEAHLETCESCRAELDDHRRLAATLQLHATRVSPLASTESNGSRGSNGNGAPKRPTRHWGVPVALAIIVVMLAGVFVQAQARFDRLEATADQTQLLEQAQLAATGPEAVVTALRTPANEPVLTVVSLDGGGASYAIDSTLPSLGGDHIYQLWSADGAVTPAVALGSRPRVVTFSLPSGVTELLVTVEHNPAPSEPTLPAFATANVSPSQ